MEVVAVRKPGGALVITVKGKVDTVTAPKFGEYLTKAVEKTENALIVNLSELLFISSAGLRVILGTAKKLQEKQSEFLLAGLKGHVKEVFEIAGFCTLFKVFDTEESALEQVG